MQKNINSKEKFFEVILEKGPLSLKEIVEEVSYENSEKIKITAAKENILKLLEEESIQISGYDFEKDKRNRKQSVKMDYMIFEVVKKLPFEIKIMINELRSDKPRIIRDSYQKLKELFRKKYNYTLYEYEKDYNEWENSLQSIPVKEALSEIESYDLPLFLEKHGNEINKTKNILNKGMKYHNLYIWIASDLNKEPTIKNVIMGHGTIIEFKNKPLFDAKKQLFSKKEIITSVLGLNSPSKLNLKSIDILFETVLNYLKITESDEYHHLLSHALSDNYDSTDSFRKIISKTIGLEFENIEIEKVEKNLKWWEKEIFYS